MIDVVRLGTYTIDYKKPPSGSPRNPRVDSNGFLWVHGDNGFYVYRTEGPDIRELVASDTTRTNCWDSIEDASGYIHMVNSTNGINAYSWDGTTLTRIVTSAYGTVGVCTDGTYIYGNAGGMLNKLSWDGATYTCVAYKATYMNANIIHLGGYLWGATSNEDYGVAMQNVNMTSSTRYSAQTKYDPETVCTDGTYVYTDNMYPEVDSIWKFHRSGTNIVCDGSGGVHVNTRGICWDSSRSWVLASGQLSLQVNGYDTSLTQQATSLARDYINNNRGIYAGNGYIYDTSGGVSVWGYGDAGWQGSNRAQTIWTTP